MQHYFSGLNINDKKSLERGQRDGGVCIIQLQRVTSDWSVLALQKSCTFFKHSPLALKWNNTRCDQMALSNPWIFWFLAVGLLQLMFSCVCGNINWNHEDYCLALSFRDVWMMRVPSWWNLWLAHRKSVQVTCRVFWIGQQIWTQESGSKLQVINVMKPAMGSEL